MFYVNAIEIEATAIDFLITKKKQFILRTEINFIVNLVFVFLVFNTLTVHCYGHQGCQSNKVLHANTVVLVFNTI